MPCGSVQGQILIRLIKIKDLHSISQHLEGGRAVTIQLRLCRDDIHVGKSDWRGTVSKRLSPSQFPRACEMLNRHEVC